MIRSIATAYRSAYRGLPREQWLLFGIMIVNRAGGMVLPFFSLYLTQARGLPVSAAGRILALYGLGSIAGAYLGGWLSDRIGATRTQQASLLTGGIGFLWLSGLEDYHAIAAAVVVLGVCVEAFRPAAMSDMAERAPEGLQARSFALLRLAANIGVGIGPAVGGYLALHSYRWLFVADAITCWLACLLLLLLLDPVGGKPGGGRQAPRGRSPWRDGPFLLLTALVVLLASVFFQTMSTLPLYYRDSYGFREDTIGLLLAINPLLIVLFEMVLVHWAERRRRMLLVGLGSLLLCLGLAGMPLGHSLGWVIVTIAVWTLGEMLSMPLINAVVADRAGAGARGRYMGVYTMAFGVAFVFAPAGGAQVYETLGPDRLWYGIGALGGVLLVVSLALTRTLRRRT